VMMKPIEYKYINKELFISNLTNTILSIISYMNS
jgi:hypothetical protein